MFRNNRKIEVSVERKKNRFWQKKKIRVLEEIHRSAKRRQS